MSASISPSLTPGRAARIAAECASAVMAAARRCTATYTSGDFHEAQLVDAEARVDPEAHGGRAAAAALAGAQASRARG